MTTVIEQWHGMNKLIGKGLPSSWKEMRWNMSWLPQPLLSLRDREPCSLLLAYQSRCDHYYQNRHGSNQLQNRVTCVQCSELLFLHCFRECDGSLVRFADMRRTPTTVQDLVHHQVPRTTSAPVTHEMATLRTVEVPVYRDRVIEVPVVTERVIEKRIDVPVVEIVEEKNP